MLEDTVVENILENRNMTFKANGLFGLIIINHLSVFALAFCFFSCNANLDNKVKQTTADSVQQVHFSTNIDSVSRNINLVDSIGCLLVMSVSKDTFEYEAFYNDDSPYELLYFKMGNLFNSKAKHALALYTNNDTTVLCELFNLTADKWTKTENTLEMHISGFSPAYFSVWFDDYNFDGNKDLKITFYQTMRVAYSYGYILTFNQQNNSLILQPKTIEIPNLEIDKKSKTIISTEYSNPNTDLEDYKIISRFGWTNSTLSLMSRKKYNLK